MLIVGSISTPSYHLELQGTNKKIKEIVDTPIDDSA